MAAAPACPILVAQGAPGSAGACGGALSRPGLCPRIWKRRSCSKDEGGRLEGGVPRDQITAPRGKRLGGRIPLPSSPLPECALPGHNHRHTHAGHTLGVTPTLAGARPTTSPSPGTPPPFP